MASKPGPSTQRSPAVEPGPPDGGWGWAVVLASSILSVISDGISFSYGLLYIEFLHYFQASSSKTSWIGSIFMAVPYMSGPIMSTFVDRFGCRAMTIIGGLTAGVGFLMSSFVVHIEIMFLTFGVVTGLGLGVCYVTGVVSIAYWFDKKITLASGLGACGSGIGTIVFAPMVRYFIEEFKWRGTILILAGLLFNMCVCGCVMINPAWIALAQSPQKEEEIYARSLSRRSSSVAALSMARRHSTVHLSMADLNKRLDRLKELHPEKNLAKNSGEKLDLNKRAKQSVVVFTSLMPTLNSTNFQTTVHVDKEKLRYSSEVNLAHFIKQYEEVPVEVNNSFSVKKKFYNVDSYSSPFARRSLSENEMHILSSNIFEIPATPMKIPMQLAITKSFKPDDNIAQDSEYKLLSLDLSNDGYNAADVATDALRTKSSYNVVLDFKHSWITKLGNIFRNRHCLQNVKLHRDSFIYRSAILSTYQYRLTATTETGVYRNTRTSSKPDDTKKPWYTEFMAMSRTMFTFKMFLESHFLMLAISTCLLFTWFTIPIFYISEHLIINGHTEDDGVIMLAILGSTNTIGMIALGWVGDRPAVNISNAYGLCLLVSGLAVCILPAFSNLPFLMTCMGIYGFFYASTFSFTPVIVLELLPLDQFASGYGMIMLCMGVGCLIGPPMAGGLFDITQEWNVSFIVSGLFIMVSGFIVMLIPKTKSRMLFGRRR